MKKTILSALIAIAALLHPAVAQTVGRFVDFDGGGQMLVSKDDGLTICIDNAEPNGIKIAVQNLCNDIQSVTGNRPSISHDDGKLIVGTIANSKYIKKLAKSKKIDGKALQGKREKYLLTTIDGTLIIAGSDMRGAIYGVYELSRQMGVSPWYWWADVPVEHHDAIYIKDGTFTDGEPAVEYRGIFINDEAPCLSNWVKEKFPDNECPSANPALAKGMNHNFYSKVFELLLRLKANYLWPAMWGNAFYADDSLNSKTASDMGIMMGTSHHEPMARNHQEWARNRATNGPWDYEKNQAVIDQFFREGIRRSKDNEDPITIGMRGDGDAPMGGQEGQDDKYVSQDQKNIRLMEKIFENQRRIIAQETGRPASKRPQIWALYKEVQRLYDLGLRVPDDVLILLCDDNWGNIRKVPTTSHPGGWGMYYHVDYVGAPRSSKWTNITPIAHMWEQMNLCVEYGIDRLWLLNVGDLKPMEYPIDFFLSMAWRPSDFTAQTFRNHTVEFCRQAFGDRLAARAARLIEKYCMYNGRVTPEMLSAKTYNLFSGEFLQAVSDYKALELDARNLYGELADNQKDCYHQLVLHPIATMANLYEMYYAQAMNHYLASIDDPEANQWADKCDRCFDLDSIYTAQYHNLNHGKWNHMMRQTHIGYTSWNEPPHNIRPSVQRIDANSARKAGHFASQNGFIAIEAEHYSNATNPSGGKWTVIPGYGRTKSGVAVMPYNVSTQGASLDYRFRLPDDAKSVKVHVVTNSTLAFLRPEGHRYSVEIDGKNPVEINYNGRYNDDNPWETFDVVATRVIETVTDIDIDGGGIHTLTIRPTDPGLVVEKIVIDYGGYSPSHLFGTESEYKPE